MRSHTQRPRRRISPDEKRKAWPPIHVDLECLCGDSRPRLSSRAQLDTLSFASSPPPCSNSLACPRKCQSPIPELAVSRSSFCALRLLAPPRCFTTTCTFSFQMLFNLARHMESET